MASKLVTLQNTKNESVYPIYSEDSMIGIVPVSNGGAGSTTPEESIKNLGIRTIPISDYDALTKKEDVIYLCTASKGIGKLKPEEKAIGTWIDGKALYKRTCRLTSGTLTIPFSYDYISTTEVMIETRWSSNNLTYYRFENVYRNSGDNMMYYINLTNKTFNIKFGAELVMLDGYVTFVYTKP